MQSSTATGYVDVPALREDVRRLVGLRPAVPVLTLYLDLDPAEFGTQAARRTAYTSLLDEAHKRVEAHGGDHATRASLRGDLERAAAHLDGYRPRGGRGLAIVSASAAGVFEAHTLPRAPRTQIAIGATALVAPLLECADARDWLVVAVDARHARFLHGNADAVEELEHIGETAAGQHERQAPTDHQRAVEREVDDHLRRTAAALDARLESGRYEHVVVGGPPAMAPRFVEQHMSSPARERFAGRFEVEVPGASPDDVRRAVAPCFEKDERRRERLLLDRPAERLGRGERAVVAISDVAAMLEQGRVETLLWAAQRPEQVPALEEAIEQAVAQSADVVPLHHHADELERFEGFAALLRF